MWPRKWCRGSLSPLLCIMTSENTVPAITSTPSSSCRRSPLYSIELSLLISWDIQVWVDVFHFCTNILWKIKKRYFYDDVNSILKYTGIKQQAYKIFRNGFRKSFRVVKLIQKTKTIFIPNLGVKRHLWMSNHWQQNKKKKYPAI